MDSLTNVVNTHKILPRTSEVASCQSRLKVALKLDSVNVTSYNNIELPNISTAHHLASLKYTPMNDYKIHSMLHKKRQEGHKYSRHVIGSL
jgi:hypothetical protein